jgi:hypothetical protein
MGSERLYKKLQSIRERETIFILLFIDESYRTVNFIAFTNK